MSARTIQLRIDLDPDSVPIAGTIRQHGAVHAERFNGWLQLTETIEAIRHSTSVRRDKALKTRRRRAPKHGAGE